MKFHPQCFTIPIIIVIALSTAPIARSVEEEPELHKQIRELEDRRERLVKFLDSVKDVLLKHKDEFKAIGIDIEEIFKEKH